MQRSTSRTASKYQRLWRCRQTVCRCRWESVQMPVHERSGFPRVNFASGKAMHRVQPAQPSLPSSIRLPQRAQKTEGWRGGHIIECGSSGLMSEMPPLVCATSETSSERRTDFQAESDSMASERHSSDQNHGGKRLGVGEIAKRGKAGWPVRTVRRVLYRKSRFVILSGWARRRAERVQEVQKGNG